MSAQRNYGHFLIVNISANKSKENTAGTNNFKFLEITSLKVKFEGFHIESLFHDLCDSDATTQEAASDELSACSNMLTSNSVEDVLESFKMWVYSESLPVFIGEKNEEQFRRFEMNSSHFTDMMDISNFFWPSTQLKKFLVVTWGSWQFQEFLVSNDKLKTLPSYCKRWCDIKDVYKENFNVLPSEITMPNVLANLGCEYIDKPSSGLAHCLNIRKVMIALCGYGAIFKPTVYLCKSTCRYYS